MATTRKIRCAIYTRKSSEEGLDQDFNSLDAQHEACAAYIASQKHEGWKMLPARYDDGGKSGGTLERPALQQLLEDIEAGRIDMVVIYKIDRLTRSLSDFAKLVDRLEDAGCSFVSVTQAFNTSSSMGRLTLNVLLSFAQFEREVTAERIRDKIAASKKKGLWMGGIPPLGYDAHPEPTTRELVTNENEAQTVRSVFELYEQLGCLNAVMRQAKEDGLVSKYHVFSTGRTQGGKPFSRGLIYHILRNPTYLGKIRHKDKAYPGRHVAIVDQSLWDRVQENLEGAAMRRRGSGKTVSKAHSQNTAAPLFGKLRDETGDILTPSHTQRRDRRHRYNVSNRLVTGHPDPLGWRLPAKAFEAAVTRAIADHIRNAGKTHAILNTPDAAASLASADAALALAAQIKTEGVACAASFLTSGTIGNGRLKITLAAPQIADALGQKTASLAEHLNSIDVPFSCRRRGAEMKIIAGEQTAAPDPTMVRALRNAHAWVGRTRKGSTMKQIANTTSVSESYIARIMPLAFLSPRIQGAIMDGTQPISLTLETLARSELPSDWSSQEQMLGFREIP